MFMVHVGVLGATLQCEKKNLYENMAMETKHSDFSKRLIFTFKGLHNNRGNPLLKN